MQATIEIEKKFQSELVNKLSWVWIIVNAIVMTAGIIMYTPASFTRWVANMLIVTGIGLTSLALNRINYTKAAAYVLPMCMFLHITRLAYTGGGTTLPGILNFIPIILTTGFLLGRQKGIIMAVLCITATFALALLETNGMLPAINFVRSPLGRAIALILPVSIAAAIQYFASEHMSASLLALHSEMTKREEAEKIKDQTVYNLGERIKELKTLYSVSRILQDENALLEKLFSEIVEVLPTGWQYPDITASRVCVAGTAYTSHNYQPSEFFQKTEIKTTKGTQVSIEIVYLQPMPELDEGPFLKEERSLINMLVEMLKTDLERRERSTELKDYKYALDIASLVAITGADDKFRFINDNFCKVSKYSATELLGQPWSIISSGIHSPEYYTELHIALQSGKPYRGEFCDKAKDGTFYWVDTTVIPFLDENGIVYQYLSINHDITERKEAEEKVKQSEQLLKKVTSQVPGNTYMFEIEETGIINILFFNKGADEINHSFDLQDAENAAQKLLEAFHEDDRLKWNEVMKKAYHTQSSISFQYRMLLNGQLRWRWFRAIPEKNNDGKILWYGAAQDITPLVDYIASIEQIIFDISHVIRRPIASMLGITKLIAESDLSEQDIIKMSQHLFVISNEMDQFIRELTIAYNKKRENTNLNIDISSLIDKRSSLFK